MMQQYNSTPPDKPTENEIKQTYYAVDMLLMIQCLMTCTYDLTKALRDAGLLRHNIKWVMKRMDTTVAEVSRTAYRVFSDRANLGLQYMDRSEAAYKIIDESVAGVGKPQDISKYKSIAIALVQLISEYNSRLSFRFRFADADNLKPISGWLKTIQTPVNELAPTIIRKNVTSKSLSIKIIE